MSHTYAILDVSSSTYFELLCSLSAAGYSHAFHEEGGRVLIDLHGLAAADTTHEHPRSTPIIDLQPVESSNIAAAGWLAVSGDEGTLRIRFQSGKVFDYQHVSRHWFEAFKAAPSKGKFFQAIRKDTLTYPCREVTGIDANGLPTCSNVDAPGMKSIQPLRVVVNGADVSRRCMAYDTEAGWALCLYVDEHGKYQKARDGEGLAYQLLRGDVQVSRLTQEPSAS